MKYQVVLASGSPRRKELLELIGVDFKIITSNKEEIITSTNPEVVVKELSMMKAEDVAAGVNIIINGSGQGFPARLFLRVFYFGFDGQGFRLRQLLPVPGNGIVLPVDTDTAEPRTGGELLGNGLFHSGILSNTYPSVCVLPVSSSDSSL